MRLHHFVKGLLGFLAAGAFLTGIAAVFLYGWVIPHLDSYRPRIESFLSAELGRKVEIASITAKASSLLPSFEVKGLRVVAANGQTDFQLGGAQVRFAPWSIARLRLEKLSIDAPEISVVRDAAGVITVAGFPIARQPSTNPSPVLQWLLSQAEISVQGATLRWRDALPNLIGRTSSPLPEAAFNNITLTLKNGLRSHDIDLALTPPAAFGASLQVTGKFTQPLLETDPSRWQVWTGSASAKINNIPAFAQQLSAELTLPAQALNIAGESVRLTGLANFAAALGHGLPLDATQLKALDGKFERLALHLADVSAPAAQARIEARLATPDLVGDVDVLWRNPSEKMANGVINAKGNIAKLNLGALPQFLPKTLQTMVQKGVLQNTRFSLQGEMKNFPFLNADSGELRVQGSLVDGRFQFPSFPALDQSSARFDLNGATLHLSDVKTSIADLPTTGTVHIADLRKMVVDINAQTKGSLARWFAFINNTSWLKALSKNKLASSQGTGDLELKLNLKMPVHAIAQTTVAGSAHLFDNNFQQSAEAPLLTHLNGRVSFDTASKPSFQLHNLRGELLGGAVQVTGDSRRVTGVGRVTAEAIAEWRRVALVAIKGSFPFQFSVDLESAVAATFESSLVGLQLDLPAPLAKPAASAWPLRLAYNQTSFGQDRSALTWTDVLAAELIRDTSAASGTTKVLRGNVALGVGSSRTLPASGVSAHLRLDALNMDAWQRFVASLSRSNETTNANANATATATATEDRPLDAAAAYLPTFITVDIGALRVANRNFERIAVKANKLGNTWQALAEANQFSGTLEYRMPENDPAGQIYARFKKLLVPRAIDAATTEGTELNAQQTPATPPVRLPALDIVLDDVQVMGQQLGRVEVKAVNVEREWQLNQLSLSNPSFDVQASGSWLAPSPKEVDARRVALKFKLAAHDFGNLLARFGQADLLKGGAGDVHGTLAWTGSPMMPNVPTLEGELKLHLGTGQILKINPGVAGRVLTALSWQELPRLLRRDYQNLAAGGLVFDGVTGDARIRNGLLTTDNLQLKSVLASVDVGGSVDLVKQTQNITAQIDPHLNVATASLLVGLVNPMAGAVFFVTQFALFQTLEAMLIPKGFKVEGTWKEPKVSELKK